LMRVFIAGRYPRLQSAMIRLAQLCAGPEPY
jgi:hypothetical protein